MPFCIPILFKLLDSARSIYVSKGNWMRKQMREKKNKIMFETEFDDDKKEKQNCFHFVLCSFLVDPVVSFSCFHIFNFAILFSSCRQYFFRIFFYFSIIKILYWHKASHFIFMFILFFSQFFFFIFDRVVYTIDQ